ncbi:MAG TPA: mannose-1-phosphate guanylyltransferase [Rhodospirillaceae bacterium]|nr:mannose-1-phosphate guanylyltransferase [Rhodospirillaceae bacterium]
MTSPLSPFLSDTAMVLAAGFGKRMQPLTLQTPKPLLKVGGKPMLDHALDHLRDVGIKRAVVNTHYLGDQIAVHCAQRTDMEIILSPEEEILETGGGVKKALENFGDNPFFVLSADLPWIDGAVPALQRMAEAWDPAKMDQLLLVAPLSKAHGCGTKGDFMREEDGRLWRKDAPYPRPYVFFAAQIVKPQLYYDIDETVFSNNLVFDLAESRDRLYGLVLDGSCYHVGTPQDLFEANRLLESGKGWGEAPE